MERRTLLLGALLSIAATSWGDSSREASAERMENAARVLQELMANPEMGIPAEILEHAKCVLVVPHAMKGSFVLGAGGGQGVATCRAEHGWSAPAFFAITGGSWGLQLGAEGVDLVMIIQTEKGMEHLLGGKFQIGSDASAAAGPVGRHAAPDSDGKINAEVLTYSRARGVFAGLALNGAAVRADQESMTSIYGAAVTARSALKGEVPVPLEAHPFLVAVRNAQTGHGTGDPRPYPPSGQPNQGQPPPGHPSPRQPPSPRSTSRAFLVDSAKEEAGFGLYSYLLFAEPPDENSKPRYIAILKEFLRLNTLEDQRKWVAIRNLNVTYLPLRERARHSAETASADQLIAPDNYNYARSQSLLLNLPDDQRKRVRPYGIYLVSVLTPLSSSPLNDHEQILFLDLTSVPPEVAAVWVEHFKSQAAKTNFSEEDALDKFALGLHTVIAQAAVAVDPSKRALSDWQDILASLFYWKGK